MRARDLDIAIGDTIQLIKAARDVAHACDIELTTVSDLVALTDLVANVHAGVEDQASQGEETEDLTVDDVLERLEETHQLMVQDGNVEEAARLREIIDSPHTQIQLDGPYATVIVNGSKDPDSNLN